MFTSWWTLRTALGVTFHWMIIGVDQNVSRLRGRDRVARNHRNQDAFDMRMTVIKAVRRKIKQTASNWDGRWWSAWNVKWWTIENITHYWSSVLFFFFFMRMLRYVFVPQSTTKIKVASWMKGFLKAWFRIHHIMKGLLEGFHWEMILIAKQVFFVGFYMRSFSVPQTENCKSLEYPMKP